MRWIFVFSLLFFANCSNQIDAPVSVNALNKNNSADQTANYLKTLEESEKIQREKAEKLEKENEKFEVAPEEFKDVDFENFTYPTKYPKKSVTLNEGEFEFENKKSNGGGTFNLSKVYFVDLTNDSKKEAFVFLWRVDCGGSCDGGALLLYIFSSNGRNPSLLWQLDLGSMAYDCGLKTMTVKDKKIFFAVFGNCVEKVRKLEVIENFYGPGKGTSVGLTEFIYKFNGKTFEREKMMYDPVGNIYHMNYKPEISLSE